jgi:hypothetical protein
MKTLIGQASPEQIEQWKAEVKKKYGESADVMAYEVDDRVGYLRSVDRDTYSAAAAKVSTSPAKFNEIVISNIWLGGDEAIKNQDQFYFGLIDFVEELMGKKKGSLKTL